MRIVPIRPEHNASVRRYYTEALIEVGRNSKDILEMMSSKYMLDPYKSAYRSDCITLVAVDDFGNPLGFIIGARLDNNAAYLHMVVIPPIYRRRGIGRSLLDQLQLVMDAPIMIKCTTRNRVSLLFFDSIARQVHESDGYVVFVKDHPHQVQMRNYSPMSCVEVSDVDDMSDIDD